MKSGFIELFANVRMFSEQNGERRPGRVERVGISLGSREECIVLVQSVVYVELSKGVLAAQRWQLCSRNGNVLSYQNWQNKLKPIAGIQH